ncbi:MAG: hypothetical protein KDB26_13065 [Microthrixaceae bacterium]|nr:hypothetical protein [Microthrixaceae bacterium]
MKRNQRIARRSSARRMRVPALIVGVLLVASACAPTETPNNGGSTPLMNFCDFWEKVEEAPPAADSAVAVKDDVVALAEDTTVTGSDCTAPTAKVELEKAVLAEGTEVLAEQKENSTEKVAAVTGSEIGSGEAVLDNVELSALSAEISPYGITIRGNVRITLSGVTSTIGFVGTLSNLDNWSISLSSSALTIPGITTTPVVFSGTLAVANGVPSLTLKARATSAKIGDIQISGAEIDVFASPNSGVSAKVSGTLKVGPSTVSGKVDVMFDPAGSLVSAKADVAAHLVGTQADGKIIDLTGNVKLDGNATKTVASFSGSGVLGDMVINEANGSLTLETNKATFVGVLDVAQGDNYLRFNGSIVWDGITAYTPFLTLEGAGEISGTLDDGQRVSVAGTMSAEMIGNQLRSVVTGNFQIGTLKASGRAIVEMNGHTTTLEVDATLTNAGFAASLTGAVQITDGRTELVQLDASVNGALDLGDVTLTGANMSIRSTYGNPLDIKFSGGIKVGSRANLSGSIAASIGPDGQLLSLQGNVSGSLALDSWGLINFSGSIIATVDQVTISGSGGILLTNFPAGLTLNGSLTSSLHSPTWSLTGSAKFRIGPIEIASARIKLSQTAGMQATRAGFYFRIIGIPTYFEGDFYLKPAGGCDHVNLTGGSFLARPILRSVLPDAIGCPVY